MQENHSLMYSKSEDVWMRNRKLNIYSATAYFVNADYARAYLSTRLAFNVCSLGTPLLNQEYTRLKSDIYQERILRDITR